MGKIGRNNKLGGGFMNKKNVLIGALLIYALVLTFLFVNKNDQANLLIQKVKSNETEYLKDIEEIQNELNHLVNNKGLMLEKLEKLEDTYSSLQEEKLKLMDEIEELITIDYASIEGLKYAGINDYTVIADDLRLHPELIAFEGVLGGVMGFTKIVILNDQWVYARFEDGHIQGYGIYEFTINQDVKISWKVIDSILDGI